MGQDRPVPEAYPRGHLRQTELTRRALALRSLPQIQLQAQRKPAACTCAKPPPAKGSCHPRTNSSNKLPQVALGLRLFGMQLRSRSERGVLRECAEPATAGGAGRDGTGPCRRPRPPGEERRRGSRRGRSSGRTRGAEVSPPVWAVKRGSRCPQQRDRHPPGRARLWGVAALPSLSEEARAAAAGAAPGAAQPRRPSRRRGAPGREPRRRPAPPRAAAGRGATGPLPPRRRRRRARPASAQRPGRSRHAALGAPQPAAAAGNAAARWAATPAGFPPLCEPPRAFLTSGPPASPSARPPLPREAVGGCPWPPPPHPPATTAPGAGPGAISGAAGLPSCGAEAEGRRVAVLVCGQQAAETFRRGPKTRLQPVLAFLKRRLRQHRLPPAAVSLEGRRLSPRLKSPCVGRRRVGAGRGSRV